MLAVLGESMTVSMIAAFFTGVSGNV